MRILLSALPLALASAPALAYVGPGAGLGVVGTLFGIVAALVLATFGLLWYPLKRAFARRGAASAPAESAVRPNPQDAPPTGTADRAARADVPERRAEDEPRR